MQTNKKPTTQKKWRPKGLEQKFNEKETQMALKHMKRCSNLIHHKRNASWNFNGLPLSPWPRTKVDNTVMKAGETGFPRYLCRECAWNHLPVGQVRLSCRYLKCTSFDPTSQCHSLILQTHLKNLENVILWSINMQGTEQCVSYAVNRVYI